MNTLIKKYNNNIFNPAYNQLQNSPVHNTWDKAWLGLCGFDKSNLVSATVSVGHSDSRLTATISYRHRYKQTLQLDQIIPEALCQDETLR